MTDSLPLFSISTVGRSIRSRLARAARALAAHGLCAGTGGNVSARDGEGFWIKPSGVALGDLRAYELAGMRLSDGCHVRGARKPSTECPLHLAIYRARPDVGAIFHTHSPSATGLASIQEELRPLLIETLGYLGGIATLPYARTASTALAEAAATAARDHDTLLLPNHGVVTLAADIETARQRCEILEEAAKALVAARMAGTPRWLLPEQMAELRAPPR
ncbi:MAG: class II aldolase/adducin family protein [Kiritimatiellia bacterium]|nr:class II aldolase/adducin family protein [Kiritimatiellia bacterium]